MVTLPDGLVRSPRTLLRGGRSSDVEDLTTFYGIRPSPPLGFFQIKDDYNAGGNGRAGGWDRRMTGTHDDWPVASTFDASTAPPKRNERRNFAGPGLNSGLGLALSRHRRSAVSDAGSGGDTNRAALITSRCESLSDRSAEPSWDQRFHRDGLLPSGRTGECRTLADNGRVGQCGGPQLLSRAETYDLQ